MFYSHEVLTSRKHGVATIWRQIHAQEGRPYGVTRVYGEQCNFVLKDAQVEQNKIRALLRSLHAVPIELDGKHKAK
ncbi:unnamed protein product [Aureobasidium pullulans]|nr:unnamed protein product [Aureobasidium pullulans]